MHPLLLFVVSIAAGFIGAMSGMGGGVVLVPALTLLGVDIKHAIAISIVSVIATSSGSAAAYVRDHITNLKIGMFLEMFTIVGALAGAAITLPSGRTAVPGLRPGVACVVDRAVPAAQGSLAAGIACGPLFPVAGAERIVL